MEKQMYPSWRFHATERARIVHDADEDAALGDGWANTPAAFGRSEKDPPTVSDQPSAVSDQPAARAARTKKGK